MSENGEDNNNNNNNNNNNKNYYNELSTLLMDGIASTTKQIADIEKELAGNEEKTEGLNDFKESLVELRAKMQDVWPLTIQMAVLENMVNTPPMVYTTFSYYMKPAQLFPLLSMPPQQKKEETSIDNNDNDDDDIPELEEVD